MRDHPEGSGTIREGWVPRAYGHEVTVSVAIPTRNPTVAHLSALLASLLTQEQPADDIIVFDDASDGNVAESICRQWSGLLPLRFHRHPGRVGMVANWNAAVRATSGTHVVLAGQDDVLGPTFLKRTDALCGDNVAAVSCANTYIGDDGSRVRPPLRVNHRLRFYASPGIYRIPPGVLIEFALRNGNIIGEPACFLFRRNAFERIGGYDTFFDHAADLDFALRLLEFGAIVYVNEELVARRLHAQSATGQNIRSGLAACERHRLYRRYASRLAPHGDHRVRASLAARASKDVLLGLQTGNRRLAVLALRLSWQAVAPWPPCGRAMLELMREVVTGRNADTRIVETYRC